MKKVLMPEWWTEVKYDVFGYTDATASWFVEVPEFGYSGYFNVKDLLTL